MDRDSWGRGGGEQHPPIYPPTYPPAGAPAGATVEAVTSSQSRTVVAVVLGVLVVLIAAGAAGLWFISRDVPEQVAEAPAGSSSEAVDDYLVDDGDSPAMDDAVPGEELPPGLGYTGYTDYEHAGCDGLDTWVYAGEGGGSAVVVCVSDLDGSLYMRGDFADWPGSGPAQGDVVMGDDVDVVNGIYTARVDGGVVLFHGTDVWFEGDRGGDPLAQFESFWYDDTIWGP
jgi:hypothetical protein